MQRPNNNNNNNNNHRQGQTSWFSGAPTTKFLALAMAVAFFTLRGHGDYWRMDTQRLWYQPHRYFTSKLFFQSQQASSLWSIGFFLHACRQWERQVGSQKFLQFYILIQALCIAMEFLFYLIVLLPHQQKQSALNAQYFYYMGPYGLLGALGWIFHWYTPRLHPRFIQVLKWQFSEKALGYIALVVVLGGSHQLWKVTVGAAAMGAMACWMYLAFVPASFSFPSVLVRFVSQWSTKFLDETPPIVVMTNPQATAAPAIPRAAAAAAPRQPPAPVVPDPDAVQQLLSMGFDQDAIEQALRQTNNNVERAADRLLSAM